MRRCRHAVRKGHGLYRRGRLGGRRQSLRREDHLPPAMGLHPNRMYHLWWPDWHPHSTSRRTDGQPSGRRSCCPPRWRTRTRGSTGNGCHLTRLHHRWRLAWSRSASRIHRWRPRVTRRALHRPERGRDALCDHVWHGCRPCCLLRRAGGWCPLRVRGAASPRPRVLRSCPAHRHCGSRMQLVVPRAGWPTPRAHLDLRCRGSPAPVGVRPRHPVRPNRRFPRLVLDAGHQPLSGAHPRAPQAWPASYPQGPDWRNDHRYDWLASS
mmetsp:Transcript_40232/g.106534  ORF Transcript_40232/g.106534 Transcript_40232/m.106534 type:complete len:266 (-) Transcript_40232:960-1757(-)